MKKTFVKSIIGIMMSLLIFCGIGQPVMAHTYNSTTDMNLNADVVGFDWAAEGRGRIMLSWDKGSETWTTNDPEGGGPYYKIWDVELFDGYAWRNVGNYTLTSQIGGTDQSSVVPTWDSSAALIYPSEATLDSYNNNTQSASLFNTVKGGLDLRDDPNKLYLKTQGSDYDSSHSYKFRIKYDYYGSNGHNHYYCTSEELEVSLPNRTDGTAPTGSISINDGASSTDSSIVNINLSGISDESGGSGLYQMRFSNLENSGYSSWEEFLSTKTNWELEAGTGVKYVYVQIKDIAGNVSETRADSIAVSSGTGTGTTPGSSTVPLFIVPQNTDFEVYVLGDYSGIVWSDPNWNTPAGKITASVYEPGLTKICGNFNGIGKKTAALNGTALTLNFMVIPAPSVSTTATINFSN